MENRKEVRYRLDAPVLFSWEGPDHKLLQGEGITRDISVAGIFVVSPACPPVEAYVEFEVVLPSLPGIKSVVHIRGGARVRRVDHPTSGQEENGFAVASHDFARWNLSEGESQENGANAAEFVLGQVH
jgi:hypothetical protein